MKRAKEIGQTSIAITDHGSSSGLYEAQEMGKKYGIKVLLGEEFYFQNSTDKNGHIILIAKNNKGLANIYRLQKKAYDNFYYKPRITMDMLEEHSEGLICTTACIANQVGQYILHKEYILALNHIIKLSNIFKEDFYIELQSSTVDDVIKVNKKLSEWIEECGYKYIITNDVHYTLKEDYDVHEVLLCIQQKSKMDSEKRWKFEKNDYWLKTEQEIKDYLKYFSDSFIEQGFSFIQEIVDKCDATIESGDYLPKWRNKSLTEDECLEQLVWEKYGERVVSRKEANNSFVSDLHKELDVIKQTGYSGYFMIVQEYANWARSNNILVGDGRGSGAGSKVAYTIGITEVNPQQYDLLFERFLAPGREPDFDIDFSDIDEVFKHLQDIYGEDNVARVGAFNRFTCKSALRKVMGVYGFSMSAISKIVGYLPKDLQFTFEEAKSKSKDFAKWCENNSKIAYCVEKLEGVMSHLSTHAGGVIICEDLYSKLPIFTDSSDRSKMIVAYDKHIIEALGHYKFDILGLNSLNLLKDALDNIEEDIDWSKVNFEDKGVYDMLSSGDVLGVFQLSEQADKIMEQKPQNFEDLIAINALIRPGVGDWEEYIKRRSSQNNNKTLSFMESTNGLIVYQDQYLLLANYFADWGIAYSDKHIRKNKNIVNDIELKDKFITDGKQKGFNEDILLEVWNDIVSVVSGGYGFNRAHSTSYARLSYQTAWLKYYYPKEFYAAYLTQNFDNFVEIAKVSNKLRELGIKLLTPDINKSTDKFAVTKDGIVYSLTSIKGVGGSALYEINRLRPIKSIDDFMKRRIPKFVKKTTLYSLIKSGAFESLTNKERNDILEEVGYTDELKDNATYEKETLGTYISDSPLDKFPTKPWNEYKNGDNVTTIYEISGISPIYDKKGNEMAFAVGTNKNDSIKMVIFSSVWKEYKDSLKEDDICLVVGRKDKSNILVNRIEKI